MILKKTKLHDDYSKLWKTNKCVCLYIQCVFIKYVFLCTVYKLFNCSNFTITFQFVEDEVVHYHKQSFLLTVTL